MVLGKHRAIMCDCRVCQLESKYPDQIDGVIEKVFDYIMDDL